MITYVDTSTLLKLIIDEEGSDRAQEIWDSADVVASAALVIVEARAALAAAQRARRLTAGQHRDAKAGLASIVDALTVVAVTEPLITDAAELAESEALRAYDAVHLAAARIVEARVLTSTDRALCAAAERCGFHIANPLEAERGA